MRTLKLTLAYEGTNYAGWQIQTIRRQTSDVRHQSRRKPTIQGTIEQALHRITGEEVRVVGSGRTDAGVHALAQVAHGKLRMTPHVARLAGAGSSRARRSRVEGERFCRPLQRALNAVLPPDIVVTKIEEAPAGFHARFGARAKRYRYRIVTGGVVLPFERRYVHHVRAPLDSALMRREATALRGRHDMRAFHKLSRSVADARRTVSHISVRRRGRELMIELEADGFLHGMVRSIVGTLIDVGRGFRPPGTIAAILKTRDRRLVGPAAPAKGLCLVSVHYRK